MDSSPLRPEPHGDPAPADSGGNAHHYIEGIPERALQVGSREVLLR
ncbi:hypothetical protein HMPREF1550_00855 [Actinomyces sp. oral taxon 877 str. F0543]|nr:hypothetical protein HMPREF1550_00855 [Actinomyces sp. oral taxon 877 str. F0543]